MHAYAYDCECTAYLWLDGLLGVVPGIINVVEVVHSVIVSTAHVIDLEFVQHVIGERNGRLLGAFLAIEQLKGEDLLKH